MAKALRKPEERRLLAALKRHGATEVSISHGKHNKLLFKLNGGEAMVVFGATPSDHRWKKKFTSQIKREFVRLSPGSEISFEPRAIAGCLTGLSILASFISSAIASSASATRKNESLWSLLNEWELECGADSGEIDPYQKGRA